MGTGLAGRLCWHGTGQHDGRRPRRLFSSRSTTVEERSQNVPPPNTHTPPPPPPLAIRLGWWSGPRFVVLLVVANNLPCLPLLAVAIFRTPHSRPRLAAACG